VSRAACLRWRAAAPLVTLLALAALTGCGLTTEDSPRAIDPSDVPPEVLAPSSTTLPGASEGAGGFEVSVYWIGEGRLVEGARRVSDAQVATALEALLVAPPTAADGNVQTSIPNGTELLSTARDGDTLVVNLSPQFTENIQGEELRRALAQIVYTATDTGVVRRVQFRVGGDDIAVLTDEGTVTEPVTRSDFSSLAPEPPPTTTTSESD
jgi:hypothetical protein